MSSSDDPKLSSALDAELFRRLDAELPDAVPAAELSDATRERMRKRIRERVERSTAPNAAPAGSAVGEPDGTLTIRGGAAGFEPFGTGISRKLLVPEDGSGRETALYRLDPGAFFDTHGHTHLEECWVVEGFVLAGDFPVYAGDMHLAFPGYEHARVVAPKGALLLIKSQVYTPDPDATGATSP